ncbi:hypothetical protein ACHAXT_006156 [Thalassiosira profunda]
MRRSNSSGAKRKGDKASSSSSSTSALVALFRLIEANDWHRLEAQFLSDADGTQTFRRLAAMVAKSKSFNGMTVLHACVRFSPPHAVVNKMVALCPDAAASRDCLDRTPLHVAAGTGAGAAVVKVLADACPSAAMVQDQDGRTPLHLACDSSCELFEDDRSRGVRRGPPSYRTVGVLLSAALGAAVLEDEDGMSAIEYALFSGADLQTVRLIQRAAQKVHLQKEKEKRRLKAKQFEEGKGESSAAKKGMAAAAKSLKPKRAPLATPAA